jgi:DHA1 family bicyclomycin/chloramphenicol resistance-like MFS transporter
MLGAFFMGGWLGTQMDEPVFALAHGLLLWSVFISIVAWTWVQRHGRPEGQAAPGKVQAAPDKAAA